MEAHTYVLPQVCCGCLGPVERTLKIETRTKESETIYTLSVNVPICNGCYVAYLEARQRGFGRGLRWLLPVALGLLVVARVIDSTLLGVVVLIAAITAVIILSQGTDSRAKPAFFSVFDRLVFRNKQYDAMFEARTAAGERQRRAAECLGRLTRA